MKQPRKGYGILACTGDLRSKGGKEKSLGFVGCVGWRNVFSLVLCRSLDVWTMPCAQSDGSHQCSMASLSASQQPLLWSGPASPLCAEDTCRGAGGKGIPPSPTEQPCSLSSATPLPLRCFLHFSLGHLHRALSKAETVETNIEWFPWKILFWGARGDEGWVWWRRIRKICGQGAFSVTGPSDECSRDEHVLLQAIILKCAQRTQ